MKKIIKFFEQSFCNHIWKDGHTTFLRREKERFGELEKDFETYSDYSATNQRCIKCEKERYVEHRKIVIIQNQTP